MLCVLVPQEAARLEGCESFAQRMELVSYLALVDHRLPEEDRAYLQGHLPALKLEEWPDRFADQLDDLDLSNRFGDRVTLDQISDHRLAWAFYVTDPYGNRYELNTYDYEPVRVALQRAVVVSSSDKERGMTTEQTHGQLWSGGARDWARHIEPHNYPLYETVQEKLGVASGTRLLDVGCGPGGAAFLAAGRGAQAAGLDASPGSIDVARERVPDGDFRVGDMEALPWPDGSFDAVTYFNSLQFAGNPIAALKEARRVLGTRGRVGIGIWAPREQSQQPRVMAAVSALAPPQPPDAPGPFALSDPGKLESALEAAGLRAVDRGEVPIVVEHPDAETAVRASMSSGSTARAVQHSGEDRVRQVMLEAFGEFRAEGGRIRFQNRFRFVIAE